MNKFILSLLLLPLSLFADITVSLPASDNSSTSGLGTSSFGTWDSKSGGFQLSWDITQTGGSSYNYIYTLSTDTGKSLNDLPKGVFVLELNSSVTPDNLSTVITKSNATITAGPQTFTKENASFLPGSIYGVQFDLSGVAAGGQATISFTSTNAPVWGSFYSNNGKANGYAYNTEFGTNPTDSKLGFNGWVPTVGSTAVLAPEPSTMLILGFGLVFFAYLNARRKVAH